MSTSNFPVTGWHGGTWGLRVLEEGRAAFQRHRRRLDQEPLVVVLPGATAPLRARWNSDGCNFLSNAQSHMAKVDWCLAERC